MKFFIFADDAPGLEAGAAITLQDITTIDLQAPIDRVTTKRVFAETLSVMSLLGDYRMLETYPATVSYILRISHLSADSYMTEIGCWIITKHIQFTPRGFHALHHKACLKDTQLPMGCPDNPYYIKTVFIGGHNAFKWTFLKTDSSSTLPDEMSLIFPSDDEGMGKFGENLFSILHWSRKFTKIGTGFSTVPTLKIKDMFAQHAQKIPENQEIEDETSPWRKMRALGCNLLHLHQKEGSEQKLKESLKQTIESVMVNLNGYRDNFIKQNSKGQSQFFPSHLILL